MVISDNNARNIMVHDVGNTMVHYVDSDASVLAFKGNMLVMTFLVCFLGYEST